MTARVRTGAAALAIALTLGACGGAALAQGHPLPQRVLSRGAIFTRPRAPQTAAVAGAHHDVFGTIVALRGERFTLRRRNGPPIVVDASAAIASGRYSAPLFVGKVVEINGTYVATVLHAEMISRLTRLDPSTRGDR